jgi:hypothetical protein
MFVLAEAPDVQLYRLRKRFRSTIDNRTLVVDRREPVVTGEKSCAKYNQQYCKHTLNRTCVPHNGSGLQHFLGAHG